MVLAKKVIVDEDSPSTESIDGYAIIACDAFEDEQQKDDSYTFY